MAPEKTEALLVTDWRFLQYLSIALGEDEVEWKTSIKYLGVQLDRRLSFCEHLRIATAKAIQCGANLARLMPNIGGHREAIRRLVASVVHSKLLYAAPVWTNALQNHAMLYRPAGNRSREGGHPQGWKAQSRQEMADEIEW